MIMLSFDTEEFDVPLEHGVNLPIEEQMRISIIGTQNILDCLKQHNIKATFFCTANFAIRANDVMLRIKEEGHEIASHGYYHQSFDVKDLKRSKEKLEELMGVPVKGYRQARMMPVSETEIYNAGYTYNSSLNPTFIPGRYMHLTAPRKPFLKEGVLQIPASVTPILRFPLFWLSYHNLPAGLYRRLCLRTWKHDGYLNTYFHPWEFYELNDHPELNLPYIIRKNSGEKMIKRLSDLISYFKDKGASFITYGEFAETR